MVSQRKNLFFLAKYFFRDTNCRYNIFFPTVTQRKNLFSHCYPNICFSLLLKYYFFPVVTQRKTIFIPIVTQIFIIRGTNCKCIICSRTFKDSIFIFCVGDQNSLLIPEIVNVNLATYVEQIWFIFFRVSRKIGYS